MSTNDQSVHRENKGPKIHITLKSQGTGESSRPNGLHVLIYGFNLIWQARARGEPLMNISIFCIVSCTCIHREVRENLSTQRKTPACRILFL